MLIHSTPEGKTVKTKGVLRTRQHLSSCGADWKGEWGDVGFRLLDSTAARDHLDLLARLRLDDGEYLGEVRLVQLEDRFLFARITANQCFFPLESSASGDSSTPVFQRRCLDCWYSIGIVTLSALISIW